VSLPIASQNTQHYLKAGYGLACAMARAEMALFVGALSFAVRSSFWRRHLLRFDRPFGGVSFAVRSF
jgi:hypothetical protein